MQAKNYLADQYSGSDGKETRDAIFALFNELKDQNRERTNEQIDAQANADRSVGGNFGRMFLMTAGGMGTYNPEAYQAQADKLVDVIGEDKAKKDRFAFTAAAAQSLVDAYQSGATSAITKQEAVALYSSVIERDDNGNVTPESEAMARQKLRDSGAAGYMVEQIAIEAAAANGENTDLLYQSMIDRGVAPAAAQLGMLRYGATSHEAGALTDPRLIEASKDDMQELISLYRATVLWAA